MCCFREVNAGSFTSMSHACQYPWSPNLAQMNACRKQKFQPLKSRVEQIGKVEASTRFGGNSIAAGIFGLAAARYEDFQEAPVGFS
jgi:hypothetical protein